MIPDAQLQAHAVAALVAFAEVLPPALRGAWDRFQERAPITNAAPPGYFLHPLALPVLQLPAWVGEALARAGRPVPEARVRAAVCAAAFGYAHVRAQDDWLDEGRGDGAEVMLLSEALMVEHMAWLSAVTPMRGAFRKEVARRWRGYQEAMLVERAVHAGHRPLDAEAEAVLRGRSMPMLLPAAGLFYPAPSQGDKGAARYADARRPEASNLTEAPESVGAEGPERRTSERGRESWTDGGQCEAERGGPQDAARRAVRRSGPTEPGGRRGVVSGDDVASSTSTARPPSSLPTLVAALVDAHQLALDLGDADDDLAAGRASLALARLGDPPDRAALMRALYVEGGFDRILDEAIARLADARRAAIDLDLTGALDFIAAREARAQATRARVLGAFFAHIAKKG
ncbi:MAG: hypothetical protein H6739_24930 [Alphaproteobacteria bacterium]|nr:hypothetical protein [Alphaproteobacteria bacterium]